MPRPRKSDNAKILMGTFHKFRELEPDFYKPLEKMPPAPIGLGKTGRDLWEAIGTELVGKGVITLVDLTGFLMLAEITDTINELKNAMTVNGKKTMAQGFKDDPALFRAYKFHIDTKRKLLQEFGLTPASRNRVAPGKERETPDAEKMRKLIFGSPAI